MAGKWNYKKHEYEPYKLPGNCKTYSADMEEIVNCAQCGKKVKFGDCYTSQEIHTEYGFGYAVCKECHRKEWQRRVAAESKEDELWED